MIKTIKFSVVLEEIIESFNEWVIYWLLVDDEGRLKKGFDKVYNDILRTTCKEIVLPKYGDFVIYRDFVWRHYNEPRLVSSNSMSVVQSCFTNSKTFVDFYCESLPSEIISLEGMDGEFVENAQKAVNYIMKERPTE